MRFSTHQEIRFSSLEECSTQLWHQILRLRSDVFVVEQECIYPDPDEGDQKAMHAVLLDEGELRAYARMYSKVNLHLGRIIVAGPHRKKGYGAALIKACLAYWKQSKYDQIEMSAQLYLTDYYKGFGFEPNGSMYLEDGIPHIKMIQHSSS